MTSFINGTPYLRSSREYPEDLMMLSQEISKSYIDVANAVNTRTIGIFPTNRSAITGESWFLSGSQKNQSIRQVYKFGAIAPGANVLIPYQTNGLTQFSRIYGTCITSLPDYRPIPYASVAPNTNIDVRVDATRIVVAVGAGSPSVISGIIILEWLSNV